MSRRGSARRCLLLAAAPFAKSITFASAVLFLVPSMIAALLISTRLRSWWVARAPAPIALPLMPEVVDLAMRGFGPRIIGPVGPRIALQFLGLLVVLGSIVYVPLAIGGD